MYLSSLSLWHMHTHARTHMHACTHTRTHARRGLHSPPLQKMLSLTFSLPFYIQFLNPYLQKFPFPSNWLKNPKVFKKIGVISITQNMIHAFLSHYNPHIKLACLRNFTNSCHDHKLWIFFCRHLFFVFVFFFFFLKKNY